MDAACRASRPMVITILNKTDISSPNYPENYDNDLNCQWRILADDDKRIELSLEGDELEKGCGFPLVY